MLAGIWLAPWRGAKRQAAMTLQAMALVAVALYGGSRIRAAWDVSENRRNSFTARDEEALSKIGAPLRVTVFLAAEDPRLMDLERSILSKLARILPEVTVEYAAHGRAGLFEAPGDRYGEVWYEMEGRKAMSRSTTEPIVLETLYKLARVPAPAHPEESAYSGHPLAARPIGAAWIFYAGWPAAAGFAYWLNFKNRS